MFITSIFDTSHALYDAARNLLQSTAQNTTAKPNAIILPGGKTPLPLFKNIEQVSFPVPDTLYFAYSDERLVPEDSPESNFGISQKMLAALDVAENHILRVHPELSLKEAAEQYNFAWREFLNNGGHIPLAFLGIGTDGHTCSLFSATQLDNTPQECFAAAVPQTEGPDRITVTPALLARVDHAVILAAGQEKAQVVDAMTAEPETVIAGKALAQCPRVSLWYAPQA